MKTLCLLAGSFFLASSLFGQASFSDDFDRPDSLDVGSDWVAHVGTWEIFDNALRPVQTDMTTEKLIIHPHIVTDAAFTIEAEIDWTEVSRGQWNGIAWNFQDSLTYYTINVRDTTSSIRIHKKVAGRDNVGFPGGSPGTLDPEISYLLRVSGDGRGNFWWSFGTAETTLRSGSFSDPDPLPPGPAGFYAVRESFQAKSFRIDTYDVEPIEGELAIHPATELVFPTEIGLTYQLEMSTDLNEWEVIESLTGNGNEISRLFRTRGMERRFYRLTVLE